MVYNVSGIYKHIIVKYFENPFIFIIWEFSSLL